MKLRSIEPGYVRIEEREYTPTREELYWYYSGTSGGPNPDNPYSPKASKLKTVSYVKSKDNGGKSDETK